MMGGIRLGKIFGIEIDIDYSWFLILALLAYSLAVGLFRTALPHLGVGLDWLLAIVTALLLFASVLVHELAHSVIARARGMQVPRITLFLFGGVSQLRDEPPSPGIEFQVAVIGPITSVVIGAIAYGIWLAGRSGGWPRPLLIILQYLAEINVLLALFNLLPGFPLDGGRVLRSALWRFTGSLRRATSAASNTGQVIGWLMTAWGLFVVFGGNLGGLWLALIGWFLISAARQSYLQLLLRQALEGIPVTEVMTPQVASVPPDLTVRQFVDGYLLHGSDTVYPLTEDGRLVGVVGLEDVRELPQQAWAATTVSQLAHPPEKERVAAPDEDAWDALVQVIQAGSRRLLVVVQDGHLDGVVGRESLARLVQRKLDLGLS